MKYPKGLQLVELVEKVKANSAKSKEVPEATSYHPKSVLSIYINNLLVVSHYKNRTKHYLRIW